MSANIRRGAVLCLIMVAGGCGIEKHSPWRAGDSSSAYINAGWSVRQVSPHTEPAQVDQAQDCSAVDAWVKRRMAIQMESNLRNQLRSSLMYERGSAMPMAQEAKSPSAKSDAAPESYTDTNNQVAGVEEPDGLKSDGTHFYHLDGQRLRISRAWPVTDMQLLSSLDLPGLPQSMLLTEAKRLIIFMTEASDSVGPVSFLKVAADVFLPTVERRTLVATVDVTLPQSPKLLTVKSYEGNLLGARRVGEQVRMVFSRDIPMPPAVKPYMDEEAYSASAEDRVSLVERQIRFNEAEIQKTSLKDLIGLTAAAGSADDLADTECQTMFLPRNSSSFGLTDLVTMNVNDDEIRSASLFAYADGIHGSSGNLYLSTHHYWWDVEAENTNYLYIHKFTYDDAGQPSFRGTTGMEGNLLNQYSMDEFDGHLRVAVTVRQRQNLDSWVTTTYNRVNVVKEYDGFIAVAGMSEPLAKDEAIFGVRFDGPRGYVVTFRQVDPLFVIGFEDPVRPKILGELKIPGFSTYLHPIGDGLILAVGQEIDESSQLNIGNKISLFDVTDPAAPKERFKKVLPHGFYAESLYNHKSFKYHAASRTLAMPAGAYLALPGDQENYSYGIGVFLIDPNEGIVDRGFLDMSTPAQEGGSAWSGYSTTHAFIADDIVYGIDAHGIRAAKSTAPAGQTWSLSYQ